MELMLIISASEWADKRVFKSCVNNSNLSKYIIIGAHNKTICFGWEQ